MMEYMRLPTQTEHRISPDDPFFQSVSSVRPHREHLVEDAMTSNIFQATKSMSSSANDIPTRHVKE